MKPVLRMNFTVDRKNKKINVERNFDAPIDMVWLAWTKSELLDQWWAPKPWKARTKVMNFKEGEFWLYAMISPEGEEHWSRADFIEIKPKENFSALEQFCDKNGNVNHDLPKSTWKNLFVEKENLTSVRSVLHFDKLSDLEKTIEMGFEEGFGSALENLDEVLTSFKKMKRSKIEEPQIRAVIENWMKAIQDGNIKEILKNHTENILMFDVPMPLQSRGLKEYQKTWELFFQYSSGGEGSFDLEDVDITAGEDVAFCTALIRLAKGSNPECRLTIGLKKINGQWKISHEHHSAPHDID